MLPVSNSYKAQQFYTLKVDNGVKAYHITVHRKEWLIA